jgi:hypothetical protein
MPISAGVLVWGFIGTGCIAPASPEVGEDRRHQRRDYGKE